MKSCDSAETASFDYSRSEGRWCTFDGDPNMRLLCYQIMQAISLLATKPHPAGEEIEEKRVRDLRFSGNLAFG